MAQDVINNMGAKQSYSSVIQQSQDLMDLVLTLKGSISAPVVLKGSINNLPSLIGQISSKEKLQGTITVPSEHYEHYQGKYIVTPKITSQTLHTANLVMDDDMTVLEIPYYETSNLSGKTVYIGGE